VIKEINNHVISDAMDILIERNTTIPVTKEKIYTTAADYQTLVEIMVYQGDHLIASRNTLVDKFILSGIPENLAGNEGIKVKFSYDSDGILNVEGVILSTNESANISINMLDVGDVIEEQINLDLWVEASRAREFRAIFRKIDRILKKQNHQVLEELMEDLKIALIKEEDFLIDDLEVEILSVLEAI
jgi:molecular chaperone DnaK